ncbi:NUDIX hydrolase [Legionella micdadei]|uniref:ADP-ribose pyrophosphatase YjhB, NUDIX family n=1 Tax=Legionella micdadei TaxID=451 RepID=A0A098GC10_LEGMI|nr:NUDIX hydrolase [Legionella micdadei]ARG96308.1 NUDIX hydrolase [Legionella micdadei]KTD29132.1 Mutator MutT protein [Legionella micdadei]CEG59500.1 putative ADP-ribose pyrophosphatase yjhB [Legionella micdadei]SCX91706.1 ADP-ribose pyrophosphatase YjhB, NUDIX family [Legionella micdadei]
MSQEDTYWLKLISEIQALAQNGLAYSSSEFDTQRYLRFREIAAEFASRFSTHSYEEINQLFSLEESYATPKLDVRSFVLQNNKLLLVKERSDGLWTLPGGFADVNESPSEAVVRETKEESGFDVSPLRLLALWDKLKHAHPPQWPHVYKCFFHCEIISGEKMENLEIAEIDFFRLDELPPLSTHRVTKKQLLRLYDMVFKENRTLFD